MRQAMLEDPQYCDHVAEVVNFYSLAILFALYNLVAILVFVISTVENNSYDVTTAFS